jgi:hypothetical protein
MVVVRPLHVSPVTTLIADERPINVPGWRDSPPAEDSVRLCLQRCFSWYAGINESRASSLYLQLSIAQVTPIFYARDSIETCLMILET